MSYVKTTDFAGKDSLLTGDPLKVIKGSEFGAEFDNIATDSTTNLKIDGTVTATANIPMGGFTFTGLPAGTATGEPARYDELNAHIVDTVAAHAATAIANTPAGSIAATTVQAAIDELDTEKAALAGATFAGLVNLASGSDIASAATVDLTAATGNTVTITGTTPTSALTMNDGQHMTLVAAGAWSLTYNATTCKVVGGQSITAFSGQSFHAWKTGGVVYVEPVKSGRVVTLRFTRDMTAATGSVGYTGFGGKPKSISITAVVSAAVAMSQGTSDVATNLSLYELYTGAMSVEATHCIALFPSAGAGQSFAATSFDADGFTGTWTKTNSPTGTASFDVTAELED